MAVEPVQALEEKPPIVCDEPPRTIVPPAFYRDDEPPEPPDGDPHWREFPSFDGVRSSYLLVAGIIICVLMATAVHMLILLAPATY